MIKHPPENTVEFSDDGDCICAYRKNTFINPIESPIGYGETEEEALEDLIENESK